MAFSTNISSTATIIHTMAGTNAETVRITNVGVTLVYLGGASVSTSTGLAFGPGSVAHITDAPGGALYAITAASGIVGQLSWSAIQS